VPASASTLATAVPQAPAPSTAAATFVLAITHLICLGLSGASVPVRAAAHTPAVGVHPIGVPAGHRPARHRPPPTLAG
jgi:hypothetical protein